MIELEPAAKMVSAGCDINSFMPMIQHISCTYSCENSIFIHQGMCKFPDLPEVADSRLIRQNS
jgi:hypothetical protein